MKRIFFLVSLICPAMLAQTQDEPVILTVDVENMVIYRGTVFDATKLAKDPGPTNSVNQAFVESVTIGDIVAVNGKPVKGLSSSPVYALPFRQSPQPGQAIADFDLGGENFCNWTFFATDGTVLGVITDAGLAGGVAGHSITSGWLGFSGVVGEHRTQSSTPARQATTAEDPANRRILGGGKMTLRFYLYPRVRPAVVVTANGPAVTHIDYSPVTSSNPARPGETLILTATGLGPVKPNLEPPGAITFSSSPLQRVNAPVTVVFNGQELPTIDQVGWPGQKSTYWVDFQVPADAVAGNATLQLVATWMPGPVVTIPVGARP
ncbi:MAG: hypothetical protein LAQ69_16115 [Acidobacteriia bacterium]|nr:hypothetical protein [Terriglobia bacterium]